MALHHKLNIKKLFPIIAPNTEHWKHENKTTKTERKADTAHLFYIIYNHIKLFLLNQIHTVLKFIPHVEKLQYFMKNKWPVASHFAFFISFSNLKM